MKRELGDGYELDDDPSRIDISAVHAFISERSYWAPGREYEVQERLVREATRVVGLYHDGAQIGFCRAVTAFGLPAVYLADVYVLDEHRGRGLGVELVREMIENGPFNDRAWFLHTGDAHGLYQKFRLRLAQRTPDGAPAADARLAARAILGCNAGGGVERAERMSRLAPGGRRSLRRLGLSVSSPGWVSMQDLTPSVRGVLTDRRAGRRGGGRSSAASPLHPVRPGARRGAGSSRIACR